MREREKVILGLYQVESKICDTLKWQLIEKVDVKIAKKRERERKKERERDIRS